MKLSTHTKPFASSRRLFALGLMVIAGTGLHAETDFPLSTEPVDDGSAPHLASYADILEPARSAVVSVTTASIVEIMRNPNRSPIEEFLRRYYGMPDSTPNPRQRQAPEEPIERRIPNGLGSGVIISSDGYILTNNHVVSDESGDPADEITVHLDDGSQVDAVLVGRDERTDVALLKIEQDDLPFIQMADSDMLRVGDIVFAIGNPLGVGQTSTMGIVSATKRSNLGLLGNQGYENFIQTDAAINRGNSGGALVDAKGRLVGINTAIFSQTGGNIGIGFAVPSSLARTVVLELIENGKVRRGYLGVSISDLNQDMAEAFQTGTTDGALVEVVQEGTPAARAGMKRGDVIRKIDNYPVESVADLRLKVASLRPGTEVSVLVIREGEEETLKVTLGSLDDPTAVVTSEESPIDGVGLEPVTPAIEDEWNLNVDTGLLITEVNPRSPHAQVLARGMVILEVNDEPVETVGQLNNLLVPGKVNKLWVVYRGNRGFIALRME
ncbi:Do family serine endopeptidase [Puniceicoccales bacterium CK1056]|uniref:Do family serine endopeptidase n=1 Tax=Oceanipulchritudo coccoides TaxID=2706888 RepID=A0A6B2LXP1_9BACT|nr:Do family serine endopeptidase [Oceanipulchritudo coccoides]NDV61381.1 Do family serine endopeptidase [Oceanipulchritudo coccoides]